MLGKVEFLIVIIVLLLTFYFVISWGAGKRKDSPASKEIKIFNWSSHFNNTYCHSFANFMVITIRYEI